MTHYALSDRWQSYPSFLSPYTIIMKTDRIFGTLEHGYKGATIFLKIGTELSVCIKKKST
jgi:hypothetical protein